MNYILMNKNIEVLIFSYDEDSHTILKIEKELCSSYAPPGIIEYKTGISRKAFNAWWKDRAIPASRSKFKDVLARLDISSSLTLLERCYGLSLSDQYWVKEEHSSVKWSCINFFENPFSEDMGKLLMGQVETYKDFNMCSPDNSSDGNLRKKWKIINGKRCLVKGGNSLNNQEPFNEVIATKLYELILDKQDFVPYEIIKENEHFYSSCQTMINVVEELIPAYYIDKMEKQIGSDSLYEHYVHVCEHLKIKNARKQIDKMIVCDYIIANYDRHYRNFGVIRNIDTLSYERIAPIYDSGSSLWATTPTSLISSSYNSKPFVSSPENQLKLVKDLSWLDTSNLIGFQDIARTILCKNPYLEKERIDKICQFIEQRIQSLITYKSTL